MTEKLVLKKQKKRANDNLYRVRVSGEAYETIEKLCTDTNMSMNEIASRLITWAAQHVEVRED